MTACNFPHGNSKNLQQLFQCVGGHFPPLLHIHKDLTDKIEIAKEFISVNSDRKFILVLFKAIIMTSVSTVRMVNTYLVLQGACTSVS